MDTTKQETLGMKIHYTVDYFDLDVDRVKVRFRAINTHTYKFSITFINSADVEVRIEEFIRSLQIKILNLGGYILYTKSSLARGGLSFDREINGEVEIIVDDKLLG